MDFKLNVFLEQLGLLIDARKQLSNPLHSIPAFVQNHFSGLSFHLFELNVRLVLFFLVTLIIKNPPMSSSHKTVLVQYLGCPVLCHNWNLSFNSVSLYPHWGPFTGSGHRGLRPSSSPTTSLSSPLSNECRSLQRSTGSREGREERKRKQANHFLTLYHES